MVHTMSCLHLDTKTRSYTIHVPGCNLISAPKSNSEIQTRIQYTQHQIFNEAADLCLMRGNEARLVSSPSQSLIILPIGTIGYCCFDCTLTALRTFLVLDDLLLRLAFWVLAYASTTQA